MVPVIVVPMLLLALAAPTLAAPPLKESGTSMYFSSYSTVCTEGGSPTCTDTSLDVYSTSPDTIVVCVTHVQHAHLSAHQPGIRLLGRDQQ